jgi:hypothetical protein
VDSIQLLPSFFDLESYAEVFLMVLLQPEAEIAYDHSQMDSRFIEPHNEFPTMVFDGIIDLSERYDWICER